MKVAENCVKQESKVRFPLELTQTPVYCLPKNVNTNPRFTNLQSSSPSCRSVPKGKTKNGGGAISDWSPVVELGLDAHGLVPDPQPAAGIGRRRGRFGAAGCRQRQQCSKARNALHITPFVGEALPEGHSLSS